MPTHAYTISKLAKGAGVNVETVRYYQRRGLLEEPTRVDNGFRAYDERHRQRLLFIKRVQELGFSLDDAAELSSLSQATDRVGLRELARARATDIRKRISRLDAMARALENLAETCQHTAPSEKCPIVAALYTSPSTPGEHDGGGMHCGPASAEPGCQGGTIRAKKTANRHGP
jgi:MerR family mercuric resistance operon transcriptional regulator